MGSDPERSAVDATASPTTWHACSSATARSCPRTLSVNPSLTIMALALRLADHLDSGAHGYFDTVREHMLATRYWWLDGADTESIQAWLAELFERLPVQRIAPGYGCVLEGSEVVANHLAMVQDVLGAAAAPRHPTALEPVR
jgi:hypothetical protein